MAEPADKDGKKYEVDSMTFVGGDFNQHNPTFSGPVDIHSEVVNIDTLTLVLGSQSYYDSISFYRTY